MKGIKRHPDSKKLWHEFFRAELIFAEKVRRRMKLLTASDHDKNELVTFLKIHLTYFCLEYSFFNVFHSSPISLLSCLSSSVIVKKFHVAN